MPQTMPPKKKFPIVDPENKHVKLLYRIGVGGLIFSAMTIFVTLFILEPFTSFNSFSHLTFYFGIFPLIFVGSFLLTILCIFLTGEPLPPCCCQHRPYCCHAQFEEHSTLHEESTTVRLETLSTSRDHYHR